MLYLDLKSKKLYFNWKSILIVLDKIKLIIFNSNHFIMSTADQNKSISQFTSGYYNDWFYWNWERIKKDKRQEKVIFEFHFLKFLKYLIYETIFVWTVYFISTNRYLNSFVFLLWWLLLFNWIAWVIWWAIFLLMLYESLEIRKIKGSRTFAKESSRIDRLL